MDALTGDSEIDALREAVNNLMVVNLENVSTVVELTDVLQAIDSDDPEIIRNSVVFLTAPLAYLKRLGPNVTLEPRLIRLSDLVLKACNKTKIPRPMPYLSFEELHKQTKSPRRAGRPYRNGDDILEHVKSYRELLNTRKKPVSIGRDVPADAFVQEMSVYCLRSSEELRQGMLRDYNFDASTGYFVKPGSYTEIEIVHLASTMATRNCLECIWQIMLQALQEHSEDKNKGYSEAKSRCLQFWLNDETPMHIETMHEVLKHFGLSPDPLTQSAATAWVEVKAPKEGAAAEILKRETNSATIEHKVAKRPLQTAEVFSLVCEDLHDTEGQIDIRKLPGRVQYKIFKNNATASERNYRRASDRARKKGEATGDISTMDPELVASQQCQVTSFNLAEQVIAIDDANQLKERARTVLTRTQRRVFTALFVEELDPQDAAERLHMSLTAVKKHQTDIRTRLKPFASEFVDDLTDRIIPRSRPTP